MRGFHIEKKRVMDKMRQHKNRFVRWVVTWFWSVLLVVCLSMFIWGVVCCCCNKVWDIRYFLPLFTALIGGLIAVKVNEAKYFSDALSKYAAMDMVDSLRKISHLKKVWKRTSTKNAGAVASNIFVPPTFTAREAGTNVKPNVNIDIYRDDDKKVLRLPWTEDEDGARRLIKHYFLNALELYRAGNIGHEKFLAICNKCSKGLLFSTVEIMENILNAKYDDKKFEELMAGKILYETEQTPEFEDYEIYFWDAKKQQYLQQ